MNLEQKAACKYTLDVKLVVIRIKTRIRSRIKIDPKTNCNCFRLEHSINEIGPKVDPKNWVHSTIEK